MLNNYRNTIERLRFMDDRFMKICFKDHPEIVELILKIILGTNDIKVSNTFTQDYIANINGKSVILDIIAEDMNDILYDIEVQRKDEGANIRRLRYISAMLDSRSLDLKKAYKDLGDTYIIFITENDYFRKGKQIYHIKRIIEETNDYVNNGLHLIYVNASYKSDNDLGKLCHDFLCREPDDMKIKELSNLSKHYKSEGGEGTMSSVFEEVKEEGRVEGKAEERKDIFRILLDYSAGKITSAEAAKKLNITEEEFLKMIKK